MVALVVALVAAAASGLKLRVDGGLLALQLAHYAEDVTRSHGARIEKSYFAV